MCKAEVAVCCETVQNTYTQCENHVEFLNIELGGKNSNRWTLKGYKFD